MRDSVAGTNADRDSGGRRLRDSLLATFRAALGADRVDGLPDAVRRYVDAARRQGDPIERVIVDLKYEMSAVGMISRNSAQEDRAVAQAVVRWCIERFTSEWIYAATTVVRKS